MAQIWPMLNGHIFTDKFQTSARGRNFLKKLILNCVEQIENLNDIDLTNKSQHGFKKNRSTATAGLTIQSLINGSTKHLQISKFYHLHHKNNIIVKLFYWAYAIFNLFSYFKTFFQTH